MANAKVKDDHFKHDYHWIEQGLNHTWDPDRFCHIQGNNSKVYYALDWKENEKHEVEGYYLLPLFTIDGTDNPPPLNEVIHYHKKEHILKSHLSAIDVSFYRDKASGVQNTIANAKSPLPNNFYAFTRNNKKYDAAAMKCGFDFVLGKYLGRKEGYYIVEAFAVNSFPCITPLKLEMFPFCWDFHKEFEDRCLDATWDFLVAEKGNRIMIVDKEPYFGRFPEDDYAAFANAYLDPIADNVVGITNKTNAILKDFASVAASVSFQMLNPKPSELSAHVKDTDGFAHYLQSLKAAVVSRKHGKAHEENANYAEEIDDTIIVSQKAAGTPPHKKPTPPSSPSTTPSTSPSTSPVPGRKKTTTTTTTTTKTTSLEDTLKDVINQHQPAYDDLLHAVHRVTKKSEWITMAGYLKSFTASEAVSYNPVHDKLAQMHTLITTNPPEADLAVARFDKILKELPSSLPDDFKNQLQEERNRFHNLALEYTKESMASKVYLANISALREYALSLSYDFGVIQSLITYWLGDDASHVVSPIDGIHRPMEGVTLAFGLREIPDPVPSRLPENVKSGIDKQTVVLDLKPGSEPKTTPSKTTIKIPKKPTPPVTPSSPSVVPKGYTDYNQVWEDFVKKYDPFSLEPGAVGRLFQQVKKMKMPQGDKEIILERLGNLYFSKATKGKFVAPVEGVVVFELSKDTPESLNAMTEMEKIVEKEKKKLGTTKLLTHLLGEIKIDNTKIVHIDLSGDGIDLDDKTIGELEANSKFVLRLDSIKRGGKSSSITPLLFDVPVLRGNREATQLYFKEVVIDNGTTKKNGVLVSTQQRKQVGANYVSKIQAGVFLMSEESVKKVMNIMSALIKHT